MWKTPQKAITPWLFLIGGACMIIAALIRPNEGWVTTVFIIAGALLMVNALLQFVLRSRERRESGDSDSAR